MSKLRFTPKGEKIVNDYISNAKKKKEEILKNRFRYYHDENDDTKIPTSNDILLDIRWEEEGTIFWDDPEGPCYRAVWPVTKTYDAGILRLKLDEDFEIPDDNTSDDTSDQEHMNMRYMLVSVTRSELDIIESFHPTQEKAYEAMMEDILISTSYESEEEIRSDAEEGKCGLSDNDAWQKQCSSEHARGRSSSCLYHRRCSSISSITTNTLMVKRTSRCSPTKMTPLQNLGRT